MTNIKTFKKTISGIIPYMLVFAFDKVFLCFLFDCVDSMGSLICLVLNGFGFCRVGGLRTCEGLVSRTMPAVARALF